MSKSIYCIISFVLLISIQSTFGQQFQRPTLFSEMTAFWNPAFIGFEKTMSVNGYVSQQWFSFGGSAPRHIGLDVQYPFTRMNMTVAGGILHDKTGPVSKNGINASYAYHINNIGRSNGQFTMGISAEGQRYSLDASDEILREGGDPLTLTGSASSFLPKLAAGIMYTSSVEKYNYNTNFYAGVSAYQILQKNVLISDKINVKRIRGVLINAGVKIYQYQSMIQPSLAVSYTSPDLVYAVAGVTYELKDLCWFGGGYSTAKEFQLQGGYILKDVNGRDTRLKLGLIAGLPSALNKITAFGPSAELMVRYEMDYD